MNFLKKIRLKKWNLLIFAGLLLFLFSSSLVPAMANQADKDLAAAYKQAQSTYDTTYAQIIRQFQSGQIDQQEGDRLTQKATDAYTKARTDAELIYSQKQAEAVARAKATEAKQAEAAARAKAAETKKKQVDSTDNAPTVGSYALFPGEQEGITDFRVYIKNFYFFSIGAGILIATVLIMIGGMIWVTSAGNQSRISKAQDYIKNSIIGVVLLLGAYTILSIINPSTVALKDPKLPALGNFGACVYPSEGHNKCEQSEESQCTDLLGGKEDGFKEKTPCCEEKSRDKGIITCSAASACTTLTTEGWCGKETEKITMKQPDPAFTIWTNKNRLAKKLPKVNVTT